jgi:hypothetical protein
VSSQEDMRSTLASAARDAGCSDAEFSLVSPHRYREVLRQIVARFCRAGDELLDASWLWQHLVGPREAARTDGSLDYLTALLPPAERIWFVAEDWPRTKKHGNYWLYETTVEAALRVLAEAHAFELYLSKRDLSWLVCQNHHDVVLGVGDEIVSAMRALPGPKTDS